MILFPRYVAGTGDFSRCPCGVDIVAGLMATYSKSLAKSYFRGKKV